MKKYTRFLCLMLAVLMVVSMLAACGKTPTDETRAANAEISIISGIQTPTPVKARLPTSGMRPMNILSARL